MPAYVNEKTGSWYVQCYYSDIDGSRRHKVKRGFATRDEALAWEAEFLASADGSMSMPFEAFVKRYSEDVRPRLKLNTWLTKEHIIRTKIVPFFGSKRMRDITPKDVVDWQNRMLGSYDDEGKPYSGTYLRTINNQLNAIFNHAVKYYGLGKSPATPTIKIGERKGSEMRFWTKEQYLMFSEEIMDKPASFYAFEILYWCGLRVGELLALEPDDIDLKRCLIHVTKSYQRIKRRDVITSPKTPKSKRDVVMPEFLADELDGSSTLGRGAVVEPEEVRGGRLRIQVYQERPQAPPGVDGGEVDRSGGLSDPALVVRYRERPHASSVLSAIVDGVYPEYTERKRSVNTDRSPWGGGSPWGEPPANGPLRPEGACPGGPGGPRPRRRR